MANPYAAHYGVASVDFCESNFASFQWAAEPVNAVSALPLIGLGVLGWAREARRRSFAALFALLFCVGIGTVALHGTLTKLGQALDEVPMLLLTVGLLACLEEARDGGLRGRTLAAATVVSSLAVVVWYVRFQHIYLVFLICYSAMVVAIVVRLARLAFLRRADAGSDRARSRVIRPLFLYGIASYVLFGFAAWCTDMLLCEQVSNLLFGGVLLHPLWHSGAALGTWCAIYAVIAASDEAAGRPPTRLIWLYGVLPCVEDKQYDRKANKES